MVRRHRQSTASHSGEHISDFERAICYYTIPRMVHPLTQGLIGAYALCLLEAIAALCYGVLTHHPVWTKAGIGAFIGIIVLGIVIFMAQALLNDYKQRRVLASARGIPDVSPETPADGLPDPFEDHVLLQCPRKAIGKTFVITDNKNVALYSVDIGPEGDWWKIKDADGNDLFRVKGKSRMASFLFDQGTPGYLEIFNEEEPLAQLRRRFTLRNPMIDVHCLAPEEKDYQIEHRAIHHEKRLIGRVYYLRHSLFLDMEKDHFHPAFLAFLVAMT